MNCRKLLVLAAIAYLATLGASHSWADYTFSSTSGGTFSIDSPNDTLILTGRPTSPVLNFSESINIQEVEISSTSTPVNSFNTAVFFSTTLNIVQMPGLEPSTPGTGSITISGAIEVTRADTGGETSFLGEIGIPNLYIGNTMYFGTAAPNYYPYAAPTVNSASTGVGDGSLSIQLNSIIVPEPSSAAGLALAAIALLMRRKRQRNV